MNFSESSEFKKDKKALSKTRVRTLDSDIERAKKAITALYVPVAGVDITEYRKAFFDNKRATIRHTTETHEVIKMRLDTDTNTMRNKLRLVFVAVISGNDVTFLELYSKNDKSREDQQRVQRYLT